MIFDSAIYPQDDFIIDDDGKSEIQQFYNDSTIFITGATGFLGKLLLEKLLRRCRGVKKIYILVRTKKEDYTKRLTNLFEECIFNQIKRNHKDVLQKVCVIPGDLTKPNLGLSVEDQQRIISEVNFIFHVAATVRFDEKIKTATYVNVRATWDLLRLAHKARNLKVFVHVSTAFTFPMRTFIDEVMYETKMNGEDLIKLVSALDEERLEKMTPSILGEWPNTYTYTKALAENLIFRYAGSLPYAIVRPSIVISTVEEPIPGWVDNYGGITGLYTGIELGLIHVVYANCKRVLEVVPADYVINTIIAASWYTDKTKLCNVYNYVSQPQNPIQGDVAHQLVQKCANDIPTIRKFWHAFIIYTPNYYLFMVLHYIFHIFVAYIMDFVNRLTGNKEFVVKRYEQVKKQINLLNYFTRKEWTFSNNNTQNLWRSISTKDKQLFNFNISDLDWESYSVPYAFGLRVYLLKDPLDTVPQAKKRKQRLALAHYSIVAFLVLIIFYFSFVLFKLMMNVYL